MPIDKNNKTKHLLALLLVILVITGIQRADAAINNATASFTVRDFGFFVDVDDTDDGANFYGRISKSSGLIGEHFIEFDISGLDSSSTAILGFDLNNYTHSSLYGDSHDISVAYYFGGTGSTNLSHFGTGTDLKTETLLSAGVNKFNIDVSSIFNIFKSSGENYLGFRFYDPVWTAAPSVGDQLEYVDSTLTTTVVPEPMSSVLFLIGGATLAARSWYRRKKKQVNHT
jgi:hypothetical protein